ncbi:unnamed protein product [Tuber aestivum]|uniref:Uncharacterized protein n=1 Tax=Tuber aestivum TaxID=59557 RepID=A0A292PIE1_9PEZI|nr:unnamed protein product [Tuber aestivum]
MALNTRNSPSLLLNHPLAPIVQSTAFHFSHELRERVESSYRYPVPGPPLLVQVLCYVIAVTVKLASHHYLLWSMGGKWQVEHDAREKRLLLEVWKDFRELLEAPEGGKEGVRGRCWN